MVPVLARVIDCFIYRLTETGEPEFLLFHRSPDKLYGGSWRMVGGKIKEGETAWQTARREVKEETGLEPVEWWTVPFINTFYEWESDRINLIPVFAARILGNEPVQLDPEHDQFNWFSETDALTVLTYPGQKEGLRKAARLIRNPARYDAGLKITQKRNDQ